MLFVLITERNCFFYFTDQLEHARVHPKFLHSNATSHKWAFGGKFACHKKRERNCRCLNSRIKLLLLVYLELELIRLFFLFGLIFIVVFPAIAELLDNAVDEVKIIFCEYLFLW